MMDAHDTYLSLLNDIATGKIRTGKHPIDIDIKPGKHLSIGHAGFTARRWVTYSDQYLKGGPAFERWLEKGKGTWEFDNDAGHSKGACITSLAITPKKLIVKSRALLLAPTGLLDFKLINMVATRLDLPTEWAVDEMNVTPEFCVSVSHLFPKKKTPWLRDFWDRYERNRETKFARHRAQYHDASKVKEELTTRDHFTFSIMRDFSWMYKGAVDGWKEHDRIFTRALKPFRPADGWLWHTHTPAMIKVLLTHIKPLASLQDIAIARSARLSKKNGVSEQSKVIGYTNR
jgi:hypothetical protein